MRIKTCLVALMFSAFLAGSAAAEVKGGVGAVTICFDDAQESVYTHAFPKFHLYNLPATLYVIAGEVSGHPGWYMSWEQINVLYKSGWEIGSHSYSHQYLTKLSPEKAEEELRESKRVLKEKGYDAVSFATPYGNHNPQIIELIKRYYEFHRGIERSPDLEANLNEMNVPDYEIAAIELRYDYGFDTAKLLIDKAAAEKKWLVLFLHQVTNQHPATKDYQFDINELGKLAAYLAEMQSQGAIKVMTVSGFFTWRKKNLSAPK